MLRGRLDGGEICEVEGEEDEFAFGGWRSLFELGDGCESLVARAGGEVDFGVLCVEHVGEFFSDSGIASGDDIDLDIVG